MSDSGFPRKQEKALERLSPFQLKNRLIDLAQTDPERMMLNAGRGNPNWTAIAPRQAFFSLGHFAVSESDRTFGWIAGTHLLLQVFVHHLLHPAQHAFRGGIVAGYDAVAQLGQESFRVQVELGFYVS